MRSIFKGMVVLGCLASASIVFADHATGGSFEFERPKSREAAAHLKRGARLHNNQSFEAAIEEYKTGALIEPCSCFDYNLGQSYRLLGRYKEALWHYQRFLNEGKPTGEILKAVQQWTNEMQAHIANAALTMPPIEPVTDSSQAGASKIARSVDKPTRAATQTDVGLHQRDDGAERVNWVGWGVTGAGVTAIGAMGFLFLRASSLDDEANRNADVRARNDLHDQAGTRRLAATIIGIAGAAVTVTGIYMLVTRSPRRDRPATVSLDLGIGGHGVVAFGRF